MADCVLQNLIQTSSTWQKQRLRNIDFPVWHSALSATKNSLGSADSAQRIWIRAKKPTENTIARIASVTKTFTTTAIMQLRDEGRLTLEDPLAQHIPEFASARAIRGDIEGVTLRRLLTHRSGLVTESPTHGWNDLDFPSREEMLSKLPETGIVIPQDSAFKYSNLAFGLLGEVVYRLTDTPYTEYVHANIIEPLGLTSTVFDLTDELRPHFFVGYNPTPYQDRPERAPYAHLNGLSSAGQLHSTVSDLAKWISFQFQTDGWRSPRGTGTQGANTRGDSTTAIRRAGLVVGAMPRLASNPYRGPYLSQSRWRDSWLWNTGMV